MRTLPVAKLTPRPSEEFLSDSLRLPSTGRFPSLLALILSLAVTGCFESRESTPLEVDRSLNDPMLRESAANLAQNIASRELQEAVRGRRLRGVEDEVLRIEATAPGFGGFYFDRETGSFVIHVRDEEHTDAARAGAESLVSQIAARPDSEHLFGAGVRVIEGRFAFSELVGWSEVLFAQVSGIEGFISIDADERANRVVVEVESETARQLAMELIEGAGAPEDLATVELGSRIYAASLTDRYRPAGGGIRIVRWDGSLPCTLAWHVTTSMSETGFLTAAHCNYYGFGQTGESTQQPTSVSADSLGLLHINPDWDIQDCEHPDGGSWGGAYCTDADAMFILSSQGDFRVARGATLGTSNQVGSLVFAGWWESIDQFYYSYDSQEVDKVGQVSGWTRGAVSATCMKVRMNLNSDSALVRCADRVEGSAVGNGDSGAPVFGAASATSTLQPLGVLFAGNHGGSTCTSSCIYYFSPFDQIQYHLGRTLNPKRLKVTVGIIGPHEVQENQACTWNSQVSGGKGSLSYQWRRDSIVVSTNSSYTTSDTGTSSFDLELTVTDSESTVGFDVLGVTVQGSGGILCSS
jgi:hypothetical protein